MKCTWSLRKKSDENASKEEFAHLDNLTLSQLDYLGTVRDHERITSSEIAKTLGYANSSVTVMIKRLEKLGLLTKVQSSEDRRVTYIELTELGREVVQVQLDVYMDLATALKSELTLEEQKEFERMLRKGLSALK